MDPCVLERIVWASFVAACVLSGPSDFLKQLGYHGKLQIGSGGSKDGWMGYITNATVPKRWFTHFYICAAVCTSVVLLDVIMFDASLITKTVQERSSCIYHSEGGTGAKAWKDDPLLGRYLVVMMMMWVQALRRVTECLFVHQFGPSSMHSVAYVIGIMHYLACSLTMLAEGPVFPPFHDGSSHLILKLLKDICVQAITPVQLFGLMTFAAAQVIQNRAHRHLASFRTKAGGGEGTGSGSGSGGGGGGGGDSGGSTSASSKYSMPTDAVFSLISCPNYCAEVMVYVSYMIVLQHSTVGLGGLLTWVVLNQCISANRAHDWYMTKFDDYAKLNRKRILPFVW